FTDTYPNSARAEECRYIGAYCYYLESPKGGLDQEYTYRAIEALQLFINLYPDSERAQEAAGLIDDLRDKRETKAFNNAKHYLDMKIQVDYRAVRIGVEKVLNSVPDTRHEEEMEGLGIKAQCLYVEQSRMLLREERCGEELDVYGNCRAENPEGKYRKEADQ